MSKKFENIDTDITPIIKAIEVIAKNPIETDNMNEVAGQTKSGKLVVSLHPKMNGSGVPVADVWIRLDGSMVYRCSGEFFSDEQTVEISQKNESDYYYCYESNIRQRRRETC